jgi:uncharacterized MAPEG superfamily protein
LHTYSYTNPDNLVEPTNPTQGQPIMNELYVPLGIAALTFIAVIAQHLNTVISKGAGFVLTDRAQPLPDSGFSGRSKRALQNTIESGAMMVPFALIVGLTESGTALSGLAAVFYLIARAIFLLTYWSGANFLRSNAWVVGMIATATMGTTAFMAIAAL